METSYPKDDFNASITKRKKVHQNFKTNKYNDVKNMTNNENKKNKTRQRTKKNYRKKTVPYTASFERRKHPSSLYRREQEPFSIVLLKVGTTIMFLSFSVYMIHIINSLFSNTSTNSIRKRDNVSIKKPKITKTPPWNENSTIPHLNNSLDTSLFSHDIFGRIESHFQNLPKTKYNITNINKDHEHLFWFKINTLSEKFISYYGGLESARYLTQNIISLPQTNKFNSSLPLSANSSNSSSTSSTSLSSLQAKQYTLSLQGLAERMLLSKSQNRPFRIGFTGYNAVTARGNIHLESFTYFFSDILQDPIFQLLQIPVDVINVGMANISPFPYGWCLNEMLITDDKPNNSVESNTKKMLDVIMLDVSLSKNIHGVEAILRNAAQLYGNPIIIWRDIPIQKDENDFHPKMKEIHARKDILERPPGFQQWYDYNIPFYARTEKTKLHPTAQEHQLMGWILGLHFLTALQLIADKDENEKKKMVETAMTNFGTSHLPPPFTNSTYYHPLSYGTPISQIPSTESSLSTSSSSNNRWYMKQRHCYTSFRPPFDSKVDPNTDYMSSVSSHHLSNIIQSGTVADHLDILLPKGPMFYNKGWVLDMITEHKQKLKQQAALGYKDYKVGYFGVKASQKISFILPHFGNHSDDTNKGSKIQASSVFSSLTICGITDHNALNDNACKMDTDMMFYIDGIKSPNISYLKGEEVSYLGSQLCVLVAIPGDSFVTFQDPKEDTRILDKSDTQTQLKRSKNNNIKRKLHKDDKGTLRNSLGLKLEIEVVNPKVSLKTGPCSVSHIIWEQLDIPLTKL